MRQKLLLILLFLFFCNKSFSQDAFITEWNLGTDNEEIFIPIDNNLIYDFKIDWGDGTISSNINTSVSHTYLTKGFYTIRITGTFPRIVFKNQNRLIDIKQWGTISFNNMSEAFQGCKNLQISAEDVPNLNQVNDMSFMFYNATSLKKGLSNWDVSNVTNMSYAFSWALSFNEDLSNWNVSNVTNMTEMFYKASSFNQDLNDWDVGSVTNMMSMFEFADKFNGNLSSWDVSNVINMKWMFSNARSFNSDIGNWDVSNVEDMEGMFGNARSFNSDIGNWDVSNVKIMSTMFASAISFNQNINSWNVSNVENVVGMFSSAIAFNQSLDNWDVSKFVSFSNMFQNAEKFNHDISNWQTSNAKFMGQMFQNAVNFNQDISNWDVSNVVLMERMFSNAISFNQNLGSWDISNVISMSDMFNNVKLSTDNYDKILMGWSNLSQIQQDVYFGAGNSTYCVSEIERNSLISKGWTITDSGKDCTGSTLSVSNYYKENLIEIYPNPTSNSITIKLLNESLNLEKIKMYSISGSLIKEFNQNTIDLSEFENGIYFLQIENLNLLKKIIKF